MLWNTSCFARCRDTDRKRGCAHPEDCQSQLQRLDVFASLALVAERNNYVRPKMNEKGVIDIKERPSSGC